MNNLNTFCKLANWSNPIDISIPLHHKEPNANAFFVAPPNFSPYTSGDFTGAVSAGAPVNFFDVSLNPHGNGTHTECVGHIAEEHHAIGKCLTSFLFPAMLVSQSPIDNGGDSVVHLEDIDIPKGIEALVVRTANSKERGRCKLERHKPALPNPRKV